MWSAFKDLIFDCIAYLAGVAGDWGLAIIIITIIFRLIVSPIMYRQNKSMHQMQKIQPLIQDVQRRFEGDPVRMNEEMSKLYAETKFNPLAGCLPMLLQMPIFIAMFQTLREIGLRDEAAQMSFYNIVPTLTGTPSEAFGQGVGAFLPYLVLMLIFAVATFLPMVIQQLKTEGPQRNQTLMIAVIMSVMMLWISWSSPAGVLLFWGTSSILGIAQQQITSRILKKRDAAAEAAMIDVKPVRVEVERKVKKQRPKKKR